MKFKAYSVTNEINLNKIALDCGIPKKYTWEEPLILSPIILEAIFSGLNMKDKLVFVFSFGTFVTIDFTLDEDNRLLQYLKGFEKEIDLKNWTRYFDEYELKIDQELDEDTPFSFTDEELVVARFENAYQEIVATVIAKSVALERVEENMKNILDRIENMVERLEKGRFRLSDRKLAKTIAQVLRHEYSTIAYIMILDRPDLTWESHLNSGLYDQMAEFFELSDRYEIMKTKTDILNNIIDGFATISHSMRGTFIEWLIVLLIVAEVVLMIIDLMK